MKKTDYLCKVKNNQTTDQSATSPWLRFPSPGIEAGVEPDATLSPLEVILPGQTHTCNVAVIEADDLTLIPRLTATYASFPSPFPATDALVCFRPALRIGILTADCVPLLLHAPDIKAVAAIHAGWKGTLGGIVDSVIDILTSRGANPSLMAVAMGPCILGEDYEVSPELADRFADAGFSGCITHPGGPSCNPHINLPEVNRSRLVRRGVPSEAILMPMCSTLTTPALPSWRRNPGTTVRLLSHIRLK